MHPRKILHPTDYSDVSVPALRAAAGLAHDHAAALVLLHADESLGPEKATYGEATSHPHPEAVIRQRLFEHLHGIRPVDALIHVEYVLSEEDPVTAILRTAEVSGCDLIVLGTHGLTGWRRWVLGSIAEEVVRRANCSVLVVKAPGKVAELPPLHPTDLHPGYLREKEEPGPPKGDPS
jgi:nucleotide-binding universal stress UspA family protein